MAAEFGLRLELVGAEPILDIRSAEGRADKDDDEVVMMDELDAVLLGMDEGANEVSEVAVPIFDPMENRLMALAPKQQLRL